MNKKRLVYTVRFTLLHVLTYAVIGMIFYHLQDYETAFARQEQFRLYRTLDDPLVAAALLIQILRGGMLALLLYPFYDIFMNKRFGWLLLFSVLYGFTALGSPILIMNTMEGVTGVKELVVGIPEVTVQMFLFSWLLFKWEKRVNKQLYTYR